MFNNKINSSTLARPDSASARQERQHVRPGGEARRRFARSFLVIHGCDVCSHLQLSVFRATSIIALPVANIIFISILITRVPPSIPWSGRPPSEAEFPRRAASRRLRRCQTLATVCVVRTSQRVAQGLTCWKCASKHMSVQGSGPHGPIASRPRQTTL